MHSLERLLPGLAVIAVLSLGLSLAAHQPTFRSGSRVVPSFVTVVDADNRLVTDLTRNDFEVLDNGKPQEITIFDNEVPSNGPGLKTRSRRSYVASVEGTAP